MKISAEILAKFTEVKNALEAQAGQIYTDLQWFERSQNNDWVAPEAQIGREIEEQIGRPAAYLVGKQRLYNKLTNAITILKNAIETQEVDEAELKYLEATQVPALLGAAKTLRLGMQ